MNKPFRVIPAGATLGLLAGLVIQLVEMGIVLSVSRQIPAPKAG